MSVKFSRVGLASNFSSTNAVYDLGELLWEQDTQRAKVGDGVTSYNSLPYRFEGVAAPVDSVNGQTGVVVLTKSDIGLGNVPDVDATQRSNHVGSQTASTISDFTPAVQAAETDTTLQKIGNTLRYIGEDGLNQDVDLSIYLDDTNLSRLVSGTVSPAGVATFTRDDSSDFTVDFSALFDDTNLSRIVSGSVSGTDLILTRSDSSTITIDLSPFSVDLSNYYTKAELDGGQLDNRYYTETEIDASQSSQDTLIAANTAKVSADGSIDTHSDVDVTTAVPTMGDQLEFDGTNWVPKSILNGFTIFPIWAEESGGLSNNNRQWSYGNGATGNIGIPLGTDCELFAVSFQAETFGTSVSINVEQNLTTVATETFTVNVQTNAITAVPFSFGDLVSFQTNTEVGASSDVRVCGWFRVKATAAFPTPDRAVATGGAIGFTSAAFANIPGMSTTVTLTDTGTVDGIVNYSALRSGGANAITEFRVVIDGNNGQSFFDTLSTFNDNGSAAHFVTGLPAGTYTVTAQALTDQPITITSIALTATAVES